MSSRKLLNYTPGQLIFFSLLATIFLGTLLLAHPACRTQSIALIDLFFTAASATCITGLFTIPLEQLTLLGQSILLLLIQIGGLGIITMTIFFLSLFKKSLGLSTQLMAGQALEIESWKSIRAIALFITLITVGSELLGTLFFIPHFLSQYPFKKALFYSFFHAVSSFCNAGISLPGAHISIENGTLTTLSATAFLIFIGGFGFITWMELLKALYARMTHTRAHISLQSKIVIYSTFGMLMITTVILWILERNNSFADYGAFSSLGYTFFHALSFKSAGFLLFSPTLLQPATLLCIVVISFIGSAPASTGSGVKITTMALFVATIKSAIKGRTEVEIRERSIPIDQVYKSVAIVFLGIMWIFVTTFFLLITEANGQFMELFFESTGAFTNSGMSLGITTSLSLIGKLFISSSMIIGRIGSLTLVLALKLKNKQESRSGFSYPEERIMLG